MKILLVEDEKELGETIVNFLAKEAYQVNMADTFLSASKWIEKDIFDLVILDITLPDGNGLQLIKSIKEQSSETGIIIVSARNQVEQKVDGLERGADDYITKPFHLSELNARIKSLMRRGSKLGDSEIVYNEIKLELDSFQALVYDKDLKLTKTEFDLLNYFITNKNRVLTKIAINKHVNRTGAFDYNFSDDFIYTHVKNLRKKLIKAGSADYIKTVYGVGYKFF